MSSTSIQSGIVAVEVSTVTGASTTVIRRIIPRHDLPGINYDLLAGLRIPDSPCVVWFDFRLSEAGYHHCVPSYEPLLHDIKDFFYDLGGLSVHESAVIDDSLGHMCFCESHGYLSQLVQVYGDKMISGL